MGIDAGAIRELTEALDGKRPAQQPTVARARVVQSDGGGTWVQLDGGAARTPVASSTVAVRQGDEVMVRIDGGNAVITGNVTSPSTDDSAAEKAAADAANAQSSAYEAAKTATDYMSFTSQGLIVGDMTKENLGRNVCINDGGVHVFYEGSTEGVNEIAHLGYGEGNAESGTANAPYYTFGTRASGSAIGNYSVAEGISVTSSGYASHSEGIGTSATNSYAHAEGSNTTASGYASHAEGQNTSATGLLAHAEGHSTTASGNNSHAEGNTSSSTGKCSHSEGAGTTASGENSHAEGLWSKASGENSHASGYWTMASSDNQTAIGKCNVEDTAGKYALIVGNGTSDSNRSNALTVDWNGNVEASGSLSANGKSVSLSGHTHTKGQVGFDGYVSDMTTTHETFSGYTIQPSGTTTSPGYYRTISKKPSSPGTGYEAIGIVGVYTNHYATVMVGGYYINSSGAINVQLRNHGSSKYTDLNVDVIVLWRKRY